MIGGIDMGFCHELVLYALLSYLICSRILAYLIVPRVSKEGVDVDVKGMLERESSQTWVYPLSFVIGKVVWGILDRGGNIIIGSGWGEGMGIKQLLGGCFAESCRGRTKNGTIFAILQ